MSRPKQRKGRPTPAARPEARSPVRGSLTGMTVDELERLVVTQDAMLGARNLAVEHARHLAAQWGDHTRLCSSRRLGPGVEPWPCDCGWEHAAGELTRIIDLLSEPRPHPPGPGWLW